MEDLYVDVDALGELLRQLQVIKAMLDEARDQAATAHGRFGSAALEDALDDFVGGWRDGRKKIVDGIDALAASIQGAIDTYRENERRLIDAAGQ